MFDGDNYEKFVESMAFYPHSGEKTIASLLYPIFGLTGEFSEVVEKIKEFSTHYDTVKELGDVLWYFTRVTHELNHNLNELMENSLTYSIKGKDDINNNILHYIIYSGKVAEIAKKSIRDDGGDLNSSIDPKRNGEMFTNLSIAFSYFKDIIENIGSDVEEVAMVNVDKLSSRLKRGVLQGSGDNR